jgi:cell division protein ZipA
MCRKPRWIAFAQLYVIAGTFTMGCGSKNTDDQRVEIGGKPFFITSASENQARAGKVLPMKGSEDMSHLLETPKLPLGQAKGEAKLDYLPDNATDWVVDVRFDGDPRLDPKVISSLFDDSWRKRYGGFTIYALDPETGHWTFLISADGPKRVTRLKLAWDLIDHSNNVAVVPSPQVFSDRDVAIQRAFRSFGNPVMKASHTPDDAATRARWLRDFTSRFDYSPTLVLRAMTGKKYEGRDIWDVMLSLGLKWGDMDLFHWQNTSGHGDDDFFSVWTSTPPGYFLPEDIAAGKVRVEDLVFGFSLPRCSQPSQVFESMFRAVQYSQKRIGGSITDESGGAIDAERIRRKIRSIEQEMKLNGFTPGGDSALHLF